MRKPLREMARRQPEQTAIVYIRPGAPPASLDYQGLDALCDRYAQGLRRAGVCAGARLLVLTQPDETFVPLVLGLLRAGGVVVMVDPGRPVGEFLKCVAEARPTALLAKPVVHAFTRLFPHVFGQITLRITVGGRFPGALEMARLPALQPVPLAGETRLDSEAAMLFTTGSTGAPKGVVYTHGILRSQLRALAGEGEGPGHSSALALKGSAETGLFGASAMMLLGLAAGVKVVVAEQLNANPLRLDVAAYARLLQDHHVTLSFCSPALARRLWQYGQQHGLQLPDLRQLRIGGAPVEPRLVAGLQAMLPNGEVIISLGATEAMPVAAIGGRAVLEKSARPGREFAACVGYPAAGHQLRVIAIRDGPIPQWEDGLDLALGEAGEIIIRGPVVTGAYPGSPEKTALAKIREGDTDWHRTGDVGFLDEEGCLWFCGRKSQRVQTEQGTLFTIPCEAVFNRHPAVARSALVGIGPPGRQVPVMVIETLPGSRRANRTTLEGELLALAAQAAHTRAIRRVVFYPGVFPVDIRHYSKINREKLARWVEKSK